MPYKNRICGIYLIKSPTGKIYIGQSVNILSRFNGYLKLSKSNKNVIRLYRSFKKYGTDKHTFSIIEECSVDFLNERERYWQDFYDVCGRNGLNCRLTSDNDKPSFISDETRLKMSIAGKNKVLTKEHKEKLYQASKKRIGSKGKKQTPEQIEANRQRGLILEHFKGERNPMFNSQRFGDKNPFFGKKHSDETKSIISQKKIGSKASEETKAKLSVKNKLGNNNSAKIVLNMETGIYYSCGKEAWFDVGHIAYTTFRSKLNGNNRHPLSFKYV